MTSPPSGNEKSPPVSENRVSKFDQGLGICKHDVHDNPGLAFIRPHKSLRNQDTLNSRLFWIGTKVLNKLGQITSFQNKQLANDDVHVHVISNQARMPSCELAAGQHT